MADEGWVGAWAPNIVDQDILEKLRDHAGEPIMGRNGAPMEWMAVNLRTGEIRYPNQTGGGGGAGGGYFRY